MFQFSIFCHLTMELETPIHDLTYKISPSYSSNLYTVWHEYFLFESKKDHVINVMSYYYIHITLKEKKYMKGIYTYFFLCVYFLHCSIASQMWKYEILVCWKHLCLHFYTNVLEIRNLYNVMSFQRNQIKWGLIYDHGQINSFQFHSHMQVVSDKLGSYFWKSKPWIDEKGLSLSAPPPHPSPTPMSSPVEVKVWAAIWCWVLWSIMVIYLVKLVP